MDTGTPALPVRFVSGERVIGAAFPGRVLLASDSGEPLAGGASFTIDTDDVGPGADVVESARAVADDPAQDASGHGW